MPQEQIRSTGMILTANNFLNFVQNYLMKKLCFLFLLSLILFSCARVGSPVGGEKDSIPPRVVGSNIDSSRVNVPRDIKELRLVKTAEKDGKYRYSAAVKNQTPDMSSQFYTFFDKSVYDVDFCKNFVDELDYDCHYMSLYIPCQPCS